MAVTLLARSRFLLGFLAALLLGTLAILGIGYRNATATPVVRRLSLELSYYPKGAAPVRILVFSDLHAHWPETSLDRIDRLVDQINGLHPDIVIAAGDFAGNSSLGRVYPIAEAVAPFRRLKAPLGVYAVLGNDILVKVDRAAMAVSLETRVPFLDHEVVEFAWRLPFRQKIRGGQTKWILRQLLFRHVPKELIERPKMGFGVPLGEWLRGPLRSWAEALLDERRLRTEGYFRPEPIRRMWETHLKGLLDEQYRLWGILMFQSWLDANGAASQSAGEAPLAIAAP